MTQCILCIFFLKEFSSSDSSLSDQEVDVTRMFSLRKRIVTHKRGTTKKFVIQEVKHGRPVAARGRGLFEFIQFSILGLFHFEIG